MASFDIKWYGIMIRFFFALALVLATYNPSGYSYYHWLTEILPGYNAMLVFAAVVLLIGWTIFIRATLRALGVFGLVLAFAFFGTLLWLVIDMDWVSPDNLETLTYLVLVLISGVLAIGMSWAHMRRRWSGQMTTDEVEDT
jgi:hypothetical protein